MSKHWILHDPYDCPGSCSTYWEEDLDMLADVLDKSVYCLSLLQPGDNIDINDYWYLSVHE